MQNGRAIAQTVSRWLPTAAARVHAQIWSSAICGGQNGAGAVNMESTFQLYLHSSLQITCPAFQSLQLF
jgi:hypothetical protein